MTKRDILSDSEFEEVSEVKVDSKNRVTLGKFGLIKIFSYKVYKNHLGQLILDPQVTIPAHEAWLFQNKTASEMVYKGLEDAKNKRITKTKENYSKYIDKN